MHLNQIEAISEKSNVYEILAQCFLKATACKMLADNPMTAVNKPVRKKSKGKALTFEDEQRFLTYMQEDKYKAAFAIMLYAGLRKGEVAALTYSDIDLDNRCINVNKTLNDRGHIATTKTNAGVRSVPLSIQLYGYLSNFKENSEKRVFDVAYNRFQVHFVEILKKANLRGKGYVMHSLRHTFATRLRQNRIPVEVIAMWLGHSKAVTTSNLYIHNQADYAQKFAEKITKEEGKDTIKTD